MIGKRLQQLHEEKGVKFIMDTEVGELLGNEDGNLTEVCLTSGRVLKADILVAGLGVLPSTDFLRDSEIILDSRGFVPVDEVYFLICSLQSLARSSQEIFLSAHENQLFGCLCCRRYCVVSVASKRRV